MRLYEKLRVNFGDTTATGVNAHPSTRTPPDTDDEQEGNQNEANSSFDGGAPNRAQSQLNNRGSSRPAKREKRESFSRALASALNTFSENSRHKVELMEFR